MAQYPPEQVEACKEVIATVGTVQCTVYIFSNIGTTQLYNYMQIVEAILEVICHTGYSTPFADIDIAHLYVAVHADCRC